MKEKDIIRNDIISKRNSHEKIAKDSKDSAIREVLLETAEFQKAKAILLYVSVRGEVDTHGIISAALDQGKRVLVPFVTKKDMNFSEITSMDDLSPGAFKIPEPISRKPVSLEEISLVIVPGVAFDKKGNRLGQGLGYYDKFLKSVRNAKFIALAYGFQIVGSVPASEKDVRIHKIITESGIIECENQE